MFRRRSSSLQFIFNTQNLRLREGKLTLFVEASSQRVLMHKTQSMSKLVQYYAPLVRLVVSTIHHPTKVHRCILRGHVLGQITENRPVTGSGFERDSNRGDGTGSSIDQLERDVGILRPFRDNLVDFALLIGRANSSSWEVRVCDSLKRMLLMNPGIILNMDVRCHSATEQPP